MPGLFNTYDPDGQLVSSVEVELPPIIEDPVAALQAQLDALTDIVLGGGA